MPEKKEPTTPAVGRATMPGDAFRELLTYCTAMTEAAVARADGRFMARLMRHIKTLRTYLKNYSAATLPTLRQALMPYTAGQKGCNVAKLAIELLPEASDIAGNAESYQNVKVHHNVRPMLGVQEFFSKNSNLVETKVLLITLVLIHLIDTERMLEAMQLGERLANHVLELKSTSMDQLAGKVYFYYARAFELGGKFQETRPLLMNAYRKACLHHETMTEAVTLNCVIRNLVHHKLYSSASTLLVKASFPESLNSNAQYARYLFYYGKILAVQLEYSEAYNKLVQALRKAPQSDKTGYGFKVAVTKMTVIVTLLMGDVPPKSTFTNPLMKRGLIPYEEVVIAVMNGDLAGFGAVCEKYKSQFEKDGTLFLIARLRHNVIKGGLRKINLAYSRISIADVAQKLGIKSVEDTECIIAKAIKDGIIEATIHHDEGYMQSKANINLYTSDQPMKAFHKRINYCLKLHANAIQAMRYPDDPDVIHNQQQPMIVAGERTAAMDEDQGLDGGDML